MPHKPQRLCVHGFLWAEEAQYTKTPGGNRIPPGVSDCQKTLPGGLEGRSPPNVIRIRRHVRRMRKPCLARFPCAVSRPGVPQGREGNSVQLSEKDAVGGLFRHTETPSGNCISTGGLCVKRQSSGRGREVKRCARCPQRVFLRVCRMERSVAFHPRWNWMNCRCVCSCKNALKASGVTSFRLSGGNTNAASRLMK